MMLTHPATSAPDRLLASKCVLAEWATDDHFLDEESMGADPRLIASRPAEEAIERSVPIHNELMRTFVEEATILSQVGSPALRLFLADIWAWLGGNREWHSTTEWYHGAPKPECSTRRRSSL